MDGKCTFYLFVTVHLTASPFELFRFRLHHRTYYSNLHVNVLSNRTQPLLFVSAGREGRGDSLSPEWHTLHRRRAGPLPSVCTAGLLPALQQRAGHLCLVNTHTHGFCLSFNKSQRLLLKCNNVQESSCGCVMIILLSLFHFDLLH